MNNFSPSSTRYSAAMTPKAAKVIARHLNSSRRMPRRAGFTVLEVLIALVVLLIGGLAIMNLFPPALNVIRGSENREVAMSQVKGTLARYNSDPASIPDAIYDNTGVSADTAAEGGRNRNNSLPKLATPATDVAVIASFNASALNHFKRIVGERHKVLSSPSGKFVLLNYAYLGAPNVTVPDSIEGVQVSSSPVVANNGVLDFSGATRASDGTDFTSQAPGFYYASYSWQIAASGPLQSVVDEPIAYVASPGNMQIFQGAQGKVVVAGPISLKVFLQPTGSAAPTGDAPVRGFLPVSSSLSAGQEVSVDYGVLDWRWLVEDSSATVPTIKNSPPLAGAAPATARDVKLSVPILGTSASGAPNGYTNYLYALTMPAPDSASNLANDPRGGAWTGTAGAIGTDIVLNVNQTSATYDIANSVYPPPPVPVPMVSPRVRTSYWATHGWAQQLSVAARSYYPYDTARITPAFARETWREYYWQSGDSMVYFRSSEAGKTVLISYSNGTTKFPDQIVTIGTKIEPVPTPALPSMATFAPSGKIVKAQLVNKNGDPFPADAIQSVRGVSVRARAAWVQNGNYTQEIAEMYRPLN